MTRFARAKGSKSSNLKSPEDSTPWEVMKEHMLKAKKDSEECKKREEAEQQRIENYNNFLKEQKVQKRKATWCDFPEDVSSKKTKSLDIDTTQIKAKKNKKDKNASDSNITNNNLKDCNDATNSQVNKESEVPKKKKNSKNNKKAQAKTIDQNQEQGSDQKSELPETANKQNKIKNNKYKSKTQSNEAVHNDTNSNKEMENISSETATGKRKSKKNKQKKNQLTEEKDQSTDDNNKNSVNNNNNNSQAESNINKKQKKNGKAKRRKPIDDKSFELIINGKEVQLVRYDGFPIMKKDADRLEELKKSMAQKGIPKSEVQRTMKLERRRAEKALARMKREVCYNCRKGGHNLSDCPDLKSNIPDGNAADGICFKCGSTEHRQFECKVQRDKEFRFAKCFICKESGHIARQCPDNPKGLYPNGGGCKLCGDVTHLRKDCPTVQDKREETSIKLQTLNDDNIEDIGYQAKPVIQETTKKVKKIKF